MFSDSLIWCSINCWIWDSKLRSLKLQNCSISSTRLYNWIEVLLLKSCLWSVANMSTVTVAKQLYLWFTCIQHILLEGLVSWSTWLIMYDLFLIINTCITDTQELPADPVFDPWLLLHTGCSWGIHAVWNCRLKSVHPCRWLYLQRNDLLK